MANERARSATGAVDEAVVKAVLVRDLQPGMNAPCNVDIKHVSKGQTVLSQRFAHHKACIRASPECTPTNACLPIGTLRKT